ncbi:MAG: TetR/AcrR family transcriptional regulator [Humibacter sp.]
MPRGAALQERTRNVILDAGAATFAAQGEAAGLADVAQAAGVARSTLYRYFPTRDALLSALAENGAREVAARLGELDDESLPVPEALARLTRALLTVGAKYAALTVLRPKPDDASEAELTDRVTQFFRRAIDAGTLRHDLDPEALARMYGDLINGAITRHLGVDPEIESASSLIVSVLLDGARS